METDPSIVLAPLGLTLLGALSAMVFPKFPKVPYGFALAGGLGLVALALSALLGEVTLRTQLPPVTAFAELTFRLDGLAAYFLLILGVLAVATSLFGLGYVDRQHYGGPVTGAAYCGFVAAMGGVVLADGVFSFLLFWELMALTSFVLVVHDHDVPAPWR